MKTTTFARAATLISLGMLLLSGCSPVQATKPGTGNEFPFAALDDAALGVLFTEQHRVRAECMAEAGYPQMLREFRANPRPVAGEPAPFGSESQLFMTQEQAKSWGLAGGPPAAGMPERSFPVVVADSKQLEDENVADERCISLIFEKLGDGAQKTYDDYTSLVAEVTGEYVARDAGFSGKAQDTVITCLAAGYPIKIADNERGYSTTIPLGKYDGTANEPVARERDGKLIYPAVPASSYHPTIQEAELALAFVDCAASTGAAAELKREVVSLQQQIIDGREGQLLELTPAIREMAERAPAITGGK